MGNYSTAGGQDYIAIGQGVDDLHPMANNTASSLMVGFNSTIPTFFVGTSSGTGTIGKVGIGTAAPSYPLHVKTGDVNAVVAIDSGATTGQLSELQSYCGILRNGVF